MSVEDLAPSPTPAAAQRKQLGAWYTPEELIAIVVDGAIDASWVSRYDRPIRVLDPACGDGRFLRAARLAIESLGGRCETVGVDLDPAAVEAARRHADAAHVGDALGRDWATDGYDLVVGNPPFRSQLAAATARGGASVHGGGPYADTAVEFLALAATLAAGSGGRLALVLPESLLASRDAGPVRRELDARSTMFWSWTADDHRFDAQVRVCALAFDFGEPCRGQPPSRSNWSHVVNADRGVPRLDGLRTDGLVGDRARLNANFRDEYYGLVPAVVDDAGGPPLITSGLIDPGVCRWGRRRVRFAKRDFERPTVVLERLDQRMRAWAETRLVPKVLVANQTSIIEAVADADGRWLPGVPVVAGYPVADVDPWELAAVLTSPVATVWAWHEQGGTGLSAHTIRLGPELLSRLPWPRGGLHEAVDALRGGDVLSCGTLVDAAYGLGPDAARTGWWSTRVERVLARAAP